MPRASRAPSRHHQPATDPLTQMLCRAIARAGAGNRVGRWLAALAEHGEAATSETADCEKRGGSSTIPRAGQTL